VGTSIIAGSESSEAFLASGVPNLEFDVLVVHFDGFYFEVNANCVEEVLIE
jgi:hypothetical protein